MEIFEDENPDRAIVFIDGNNLYHALKEKGWKTWVDIGLLAKKIVGERELISIYYYNAPPPGGKKHTKKGNEFLAQVKRTAKVIYRDSWLQQEQKSDEYGAYQSYREKGGDTALSTDLVALAATNDFDVAIIISSDGDFAPAARIVKEKFSKMIECVYFEGRRPFAMESCALMRLFRPGFIG